ncbi:hypothetical protein E2986_01803 [Frieseomelitta varia]|uniref:Uncharacterized protein n=1 Tax=Frieseomelitta varia TaxID=561572 RepID=A0A833SH78_9HYME|nr:hypothetical protein E2986_01803 [Frieseomelitta varia]
MVQRFCTSVAALSLALSACLVLPRAVMAIDLSRFYGHFNKRTAKRPPVEETASFLQSLLASHGPNYLEKLFGTKARDTLKPLGGVNTVAIALSESQTIEDFGAALHLMRSDLEHLRSVFMAVENGDLGMLKSIGIKDSELGDVKFFLEKLVKTGFLD